MIGTKISPKLSDSQVELFNQLTAGLHREDVAARVARRQAKGKVSQVASQPAIDPLFRVEGPVRVLRDVAGTAYRAGQQGKVLALHNMPSKVLLPAGALKAAKVVAEVLVNGALDSDTVSLADLEALA